MCDLRFRWQLFITVSAFRTCTLNVMHYNESYENGTAYGRAILLMMPDNQN